MRSIPTVDSRANACLRMQLFCSSTPVCRAAQIRQCVLGPQEHNPETGITSTVVYYGVEVEGRTIVKWASDQAFVGIVQASGQAATLHCRSTPLLVRSTR